MSFGTNLQYIRRTRGLTQEQLAEQMQVSRQSVSKWESDAMLPELDKLIFLCDQYGCTMDSLLRGDLAAEAAEDTAGYDARMTHFARQMAMGVFLVLAGVASIGLFEFLRYALCYVTPLTNPSAVPDELAVILFFLILICAVSLLILGGMQYDYYVKKHPYIEPFYTEAELEAHAAWFTQQIVIGVATILGDVVVLLAGGMLLTNNGPWDHLLDSSDATDGLLLGIFMLLLGSAVARLTYAGVLHEKYNIEAYNRKNALTPEEKAKDNLVERLCGCIMLAATAVFLVTGFVWQAWDRNWLAFAVGGLGCAIVATALGREET